MHWPFFRGGFLNFDNSAVHGTDVVIHDISATLTGTGSLTGTVYLDISITTVLSGTGTLTAVVTLDVIATATLTGNGALTSNVSTDIITSAALSGTGALTSSVGLDIPTSSTLSGTGAATGSVTTQPEIHADMPGNGNATGTVTVVSSAQPTPGSYKPRVTDYPKLPKYDRVRRRVAKIPVKVHAVLANLKLRSSLQATVISLINIAASLVAHTTLKAKVSIETTLYKVRLHARSTHNASVSIIHDITATFTVKKNAVNSLLVSILPEVKLTVKTQVNEEIDTENEDLMLLFDDITEFLQDTPLMTKRS